MPRRFACLALFLGHPRARHMLVACGLVIGLVLGFGTAWLIVVARQDDIAHAKRELQNLSFVLAEETDRAFQSMELLQLSLIQKMRAQGIDTPEKFERELGSQDVQQELQRRIAGLPQISALRLISCGGQMISLSSTWPAPDVNVSDRDYFQELTSDPSRVSFIGSPVLSRTDNQWTILFARAFTAPDGQLIGLVSAGMHLDVFERLFARISVDRDASFSLFRDDGVMLARFPRVDADIGQAYGAVENFRNVRIAVDHDVFTQVSMIDGKPRLIAPHSAAHYPLILSATDTLEAVLQHWWVRTRLTAGVATLAELVLAWIVLLGVRQLRGQERLVAANAAALQADAARARAESELTLARQREVSEHEARVQSERFDVALSNMLQGLLMFDAAGRLLILNRRFAELFCLPEDAARTATNYTDVVKMVLHAGTVTPDDMAAVRTWRRNVVADRGRASFAWDLAAGRVLMVTHQTMPDGWITTYEDVTERRQADVRMAHMARHDALTDLPNRVMFREKLEDALAHVRRGQYLALHCLDLDQFKAVNDTLGHPVGDALLQAVARRLTDQTRETDTVARLGGDEFALVQASIEKPTDAAAFAERLLAMVDEPFVVQGHQIIIGTSIGIAFAPQDGLHPDQLLKSADLALYRAKTEGRGIYRLFQAEMDAQMQTRRLLELDLRNALRCGQMELFYQPLLNIRTRSVAGFEALLRWRHPTKGLVPPDQFIPLAEEIGAIVPLGEWVLRQACASAAAWPDGLKVAVNLSPVQFKSRNLVAAVAKALGDSGLSPGRLELEITETVMLHDTAATLATLHELRTLGACIAMDDFGTGYSSLSYLRKFPFDRIKIDQSFVRELGKQRDSSAIVRAVTALSQELGMATTAEGVETREQLSVLAMAGCTDVQGFLFSPPVPEPAIAELLRSMPAMKDMLPRGAAAAGPAMVDELEAAE